MRSLRCALAWLCFGFALTTAALPVQGQPIAFRGQVVNAADRTPIQNATIELDLHPADGQPEFSARSDAFGFFVLTNVPPGSYDLITSHPAFLPKREAVNVTAETALRRTIQLLPVAGKSVFDVFFEVYGLATQVRLPDAEVTVEYWRPDGDISGAPDAVLKQKTDPLGKVTFSGLEDGFYRFEVQRFGWEPVVYQPSPEIGVISGDRVRLIRSHLAAVFMKPIHTNLKISVKGYDTVEDAPDKPLKDVVIKATGYDFAFNNEVFPTRTGLSGEDGSLTFTNLVPVNFKVSIARLGYEPKEIEVRPNASGGFDAVAETIDLQPTKVKVVFKSPYNTTDAVDGAHLLLRGILGSNSDGIEREMDASVEADGTTVSATFEHLLPGRYWLHNVHEATISGLPDRSGPLPAASSFHVAFMPKETYAEVSPATTEDVELDLEPVPARIHGRLWATDHVGDMTEEPCYSEPYRIFHQMAQNGITFLEEEAADLLNETNGVVRVDTDDSGAYTALVIPGIFGIQIPEMSNYSGHNIEFGDLSAGQAPQEGPWPYSEPWPYQTFEFGHHRGGVAFDSDHEYQLDLFVHRHYINIRGRVTTEGDPFGQLILRMDQDGTGVVSVPYDYLRDTGGEVVLEGGGLNKAVPLDSGDNYLIEDVPAGEYVLRVAHPDYTMDPVPITISPFPAPGMVPAVAPYMPGYFFSGITHCDNAFTLKATWAHPGTIQIQQYSFNPDEGYQKAGITRPNYLTLGLQGESRVFSYTGEGVPPGSYAVWLKYGDGWYSATGSGEMLFDGAQDGRGIAPDNTPPNNPPTDGGYTLELHAVSSGDPSKEISNVTVTYSGNKSYPAGGQVSHSGEPYPTDAKQKDGQWYKSLFHPPVAEVIDPGAQLVRVTIYMDRAMVISGKITTDDDTLIAIPGAAVVVRNRFGNPIGQTVSEADGRFEVTRLVPQPIYLDINRRGFIPQRLRISPPSLDNPDVTGIKVAMKSVPAPTISSFTMNRFGMFLPGVTKSGDGNIPIIGGSGFNPENGRKKLTATWKASAAAQDFSVSLDGFVDASGNQKPPETFAVHDTVTEVWLVDRRAFAAPFVNDLNQTAKTDVAPPAPFNYVTARDWLSKMTAAKKSGLPYYVVHRVEMKNQPASIADFEGALQLWDLPSGVFRPMLVAITKSGGVAVKDYELPTGGTIGKQPNYLQGLNLPRWAASILEIVGTAAVLPKAELDVVNKNYGDNFLKLGTFSPKIEARIGLVPIGTNSVVFNPTDDILKQDLYLTYKYVLGVEVPLGEKTPHGTILGLAPKFLGIKIDGVDLEFEVAGNENKWCLAMVFPKPKKVETEELDPNYQKIQKDYEPSLAESAEKAGAKVKYDGPEFNVTAKFGTCFTLGADELGNNRIKSYTLVLEAQGTVSGAAKVEITKVIELLPYGKPFNEINELVGELTTDGSKLLTIDAVFEGTAGGKYTIEMTGNFPEGIGGTIERGKDLTTPSWNLIGGVPSPQPTLAVSRSIKIILRAAVGLNIDALFGAIEGTGLIQVGAPKGASDTDGVFLTLNNEAKDPLIQKIEGAISLILRAKLSLYVTKISKQWQYDFLTFVIDRSSEPMFTLTPLNVSSFVITPGTAAPQTFVGSGGTVIKDFYEGGSLDLSGGDQPLLLFTGIDPATGEMTVMVSRRTGDQWSAPMEISRAGGVASLATIKGPDGRWLAVWSELSAEDVLNPYPSMTIKYSVADASGANWSAPATVVSATHAMFDLKLASTVDRTHLVYLSTDQGPGGRRRLETVAWDGSTWGPAKIVIDLQLLAGFDATGDGGDSAFIVAATGGGDLLELRWDGMSWGSPIAFAHDADRQVSAAYDADGRAVVLWKGLNNALNWSVSEPGTGTWRPQVAVVPQAVASEVQVLPVIREGQTANLLAWVEGGESTAVWTAWVDPNGNVLAESKKSSPEQAGRYSGLKLRPSGDGRAVILAEYETDTTTVKEWTVGLPTGQDCDGDGIPDAQAIAQGLVMDCNGNGVPDSCDIADGTLNDRNRNGLADDCEDALPGDCNRNGIQDADEIFLGIAMDENRNGIPDDCESVSVFLAPVLPGTRAHFYRAGSLRVQSRTAEGALLEYDGVLEEADSILGPWTPVEP